MFKRAYYVGEIALMWLLFVSSGVNSQGDSSFTFQDFTPTIGTSLNKLFTTTLVVVETDSFYSTTFPGFIETVVNSVDEANRTFTITYEVSYNYQQFTADASTDSIVQNAIGSVSSVKSGLEQLSVFNERYSVLDDPSNFTFTGHGVCQSVSCGSTQVFCNETELGLSPVCKSICFNRTICQNGASCVHNAANATPSCNCLASATVWYIGRYCEFKVEVWMIAVFLVGYLLLVFIILVIGCVCWNRAGKAKAERPIETNRLKESPNASRAKTNVQLWNNKEPSKNKPPKTRRSLSMLSNISEEDPIVGPSSAKPDDHGDTSSSEQEDESRSGVTSRSSSPSQQEIRPYNVLNYEQRSANAQDELTAYDSLDVTGNKSTQTNTRIAVELPDSILERNLS